MHRPARTEGAIVVVEEPLVVGAGGATQAPQAPLALDVGDSQGAQLIPWGRLLGPAGVRNALGRVDRHIAVSVGGDDLQAAAPIYIGHHHARPAPAASGVRDHPLMASVLAVDGQESIVGPEHLGPAVATP